MFKSSKLYTFYILTIVTIVLLSAKFLMSQSKLIEFKETRQYFGTFVTIHVYATRQIDVQSVVNQCWLRFDKIQKRMNTFSDESQVAALNKFGHKGIQVDPELFFLLTKAITFSEKTEGAFDITILPLKKLWIKAQRNNVLPNIEAIQKTLAQTGYRHIELGEDNKVRFKQKQMGIDLGAIAKGYAVDEAIKILKQNHLAHFMIEAGGDIHCAGEKAGQKPWSIGIQNPVQENTLIDIINIKDLSVTTSGNYFRFYLIGNQKYSHILNPLTGYPEDSVISSTVIAPTATEADAYSTALSVMGGKKGLAFINSQPGIEAFIIEQRNGELVHFISKGYSLFQKMNNSK